MASSLTHWKPEKLANTTTKQRSLILKHRRHRIRQNLYGFLSNRAAKRDQFEGWLRWWSQLKGSWLQRIIWCRVNLSLAEWYQGTAAALRGVKRETKFRHLVLNYWQHWINIELLKQRILRSQPKAGLPYLAIICQRLKPSVSYQPLFPQSLSTQIPSPGEDDIDQYGIDRECCVRWVGMFLHIHLVTTLGITNRMRSL